MFDEDKIEALEDLVNAESHQKREAVITIVQKLVDAAVEDDSVIFEGLLQPEIYQNWAETQLWVSLRHLEFAINLLAESGIIEVDHTDVIIRKLPNASDVENAISAALSAPTQRKYFVLSEAD